MNANRKLSRRHADDKGNEYMTVLAKPCERMISLDIKLSPDFTKRFNSYVCSFLTEIRCFLNKL